MSNLQFAPKSNCFVMRFGAVLVGAGASFVGGWKLGSVLSDEELPAVVLCHGFLGFDQLFRVGHAVEGVDYFREVGVLPRRVVVDAVVTGGRVL
jgi:hypothetical protein